MAEFSNPSEIARETLRQLALRRIAPTPEHYLQIYHEIAGTQPAVNFSETFIRQLTRRLPRDTGERQRLARQLNLALAEGRAEACEQALSDYLDSFEPPPQPDWGETIADLLRQWEGRQLGWTTARKREALERVLAAGDPITLHTRLQGLLRSWTQAPVDPEQPPPAVAPTHLSAPPAAPEPAVEIRLVGNDAAGELLAAQRTALLLALDTVLPAFLGEHPELLADAAMLADLARKADSQRALATLGTQLRGFAHRLEMTAADSAEIRAGLAELLRLLLQNIDELVIDDQWLTGQIAMLREVIDQPATPRLIDDAGRRLKEVIYKQSQLKHNLAEAQRALKETLAGFVDQLARLAASTGSYHDKMGRCAQKIAEARDIAEIGTLLDEVMAETRSIQREAGRSHAELEAARQRASTAETRIAAMQQELDEASRLMRHDQLTGALNRRGLEEMFAVETSRAARRHAPLSLALLDLDNFKKLNDSLGHQAGDDALIHLVATARQHLRPQDTLARHGGEEFVILLPDTDPEQASAALVRLQRELTRSYFMAGNQKVVITFSAGTTPWIAGEPLDRVLARADAAMYEAKHSGKNRVVLKRPEQ